MTKSRRFVIGCLGILCLTYLGIKTKDASAVAMSIAVIAIGVAAANSYEARKP